MSATGSFLNARSINPYAAEPQPLHVDTDLLPGAHGPAVCGSIWLLDDSTSGNGATRFVPGSHLSGQNPRDVLDSTPSNGWAPPTGATAAQSSLAKRTTWVWISA